MIKGAKTIAQFKILKWINENFERGSVEVVFDEKDRTTVTDHVGGSMSVTYCTSEGIKREVLL